MNEETYFLNKKLRYQKRSVIQTLNMVENISEIKKEEKEKDEEKKEEGINFVLNHNIQSGEKRIIQRIIKFYLKANILKINLKEFREIKDKRSKSVGPNIKFNFKVKKAQIEEKIRKVNNNNTNNKTKNFQSIIKTRNQVLKNEEIINKKNNKKEKNDNDILDINENKEEKIDFSKIKGDTYLLSKEKVTNKNIFSKIPNFKGVIDYKYSFDSFWAGKLLDLKDEYILKKYEFK